MTTIKNKSFNNVYDILIHGYGTHASHFQNDNMPDK